MKISRRGYIQLASLIITGGLTVSSAFAMGPVVARVTDAGTNPDGSVYVIFDRPVVNCDKKELNRFDVANEHPAKNQVLLIAITALASFGSAKINLTSCQNGLPQFIIGKAYFQLTSEKAAPLTKK